MSGFFGLLRLDGARVDERFLERIAGQLRFRGPDATNIWVEANLGVCFTYLATGPGKQAAHQPVGLDDRLWLVGDVRLDGRRELIAELARGGDPVAADASSEELLLHAWRLWGEASLQRILGDFSFALWDAGQKCLWCARDFVGARPFFYAYVGSVFSFSNTLETLRVLPEVSGELDEAFLGDLFLRGYCGDPTRTIYGDIRRLAPGHLLKLPGGSLEVRRFLALPIEEPLRLKRDEEYLEAYRELLQQVVFDRLPKGATALYLSGGLDSSTVCAIAAQIASQRGQRDKLKAFTFSWRPLLEDAEPDFALLSAKHLGLVQEVLEEANFVPFDGRNEDYRATPEPTLEVFFARALRQYRRIGQQARVVLSGDGGDDVLTGQAWPFLVDLWNRGEWGEIVRTMGGFALYHGRIPPLRGGFRGRVRRWLKNENKWEGYPDWINPDFEKRAGLRERWTAVEESAEDRHPIHPAAYAALHRAYWAGILEGEDAGWTRVPLESRAPLLDLRLLRFLLRIPPVPWCVNKELNRRAMDSFLPGPVLQRPKLPLVRDPLEACIEKGLWKPQPPEGAPEIIHRFVIWKKWCATLKYTKSSMGWTQLTPIAFIRWLKAIENGAGIE